MAAVEEIRYSIKVCVCCYQWYGCQCIVESIVIRIAEVVYSAVIVGIATTGFDDIGNAVVIAVEVFDVWNTVE